MAYYPSLRDYKTKSERVRIIENIQRLKSALEQEVPRKNLEENLLIATWNIRELGKNDKAVRMRESLFYMAEVISSYDLVAVQEIGNDLKDLKELVKILGPEWDYLITNITEGASGNGERLAFLFDTRKVIFRKVVGEIVLPDPKGASAKQLARTPFIVAFQSGWFKFYITTVHIYYGKATKSSAEYKRRAKEINDVATFLKKRTAKEKENHLILGDFNITGRDKNDATLKALLDGGFKIPPALLALSNANTNADGTMPYDQIAYIDQPGYMEFNNNTNSVGIFNFFQHVFRKEDETIFEGEVKKSKLSYKQWKTFQMSDHLPLWIEFKVDFSENYLNKLKTEEYKK
ncbi:endonuclease [Chryseotalea sanaruensis]|uniref:Endonuclease n=1 Tax=Chryseotalea sanaruensis TaxID=2482724 RepID=A0A401UF32_9BACT|nr:endonuclease/exonuclease/phosphatase family protein [Chryseotalea sanaruensis]GCC53506.1 endonuclease [Chryseotalea sanaruensis]